MSSIATPLDRKTAPAPAPALALDLALVIPVYNEAVGLDSLRREVEAACDALRLRYRILWINDCSPDGSGAILDAFVRDDPQKHGVIHRPQNMGIAYAWRDSFGLQAAIVGLIPSDGQFHPRHLGEVIQAMRAGHDAVIVTRRKRADTPKRKVISALSHGLEYLLLRNSYSDIHWVHFWRGALLEDVRWFATTTAIDAEWIYHIRKMSDPSRILALDLPHYPRSSGTASGGKAGTTLLRLSLRTLIDMIKVAWRVRIRGNRH